MSSELESATKAFRRAEAQAAERRTALHEAIVEAVQGGLTKSEVARRTGYTREYVAMIVTEAQKRQAQG